MTDHFLDTVQGTVADGALQHLEQFHRARYEGFAGTLEAFVDERRLPRFSVQFGESSGMKPVHLAQDIAEPAIRHEGAQVIAVINKADGGLVEVRPAP